MSEHHTPGFPQARTEDLVTETIGAETVVYDGLSKDAHFLTPVAAAVFAAADGKTPVEALAGHASEQLGEVVTDADVELALAELEERNLMTVIGGTGVSRRDLLRKGALVGGAALAAPMVVSLATPEYGHAGSLSSLSYVVLVFKGSDGKYYRAKWQSGSAICGWGFATPGTGCTYPIPAAGQQSQACIAGLNVQESANGSGDTQIRVTWTNSALKLIDVRIKCANQCHTITGLNQSSPSPNYIGCP